MKKINMIKFIFKVFGFIFGMSIFNTFYDQYLRNETLTLLKWIGNTIKNKLF